MPVITEYGLCRLEDGTLVVNLTPPGRIDNMTIRYLETKRFGQQTSGYVEKWYASGYNTVSGISIINSGEGVMRITMDSVETSGREYGNYSFRVERMDSGYRTVIAEGYRMVNP